MSRLAISWQQTVVLVAAMLFMFFFVRQGLGDVKAAGAALVSGAMALGYLFQTPPSSGGAQ